MTQGSRQASRNWAALKPPRPRGWPLERALHLMAGTVILVTVVLAQLTSPLWLIATCFVGASLLLDAFAGWCPAGLVLHRLGLRTSAECALQPSGSAGR